ncbi:MAG: TIGR04013 family B12-binding domain/radical SAM domain-containing protein [Thermodesulfobacteriota bacterium]
MNLLLYLNRLNKFSFNALLGAAESLLFFDTLKIVMPPDPARLRQGVQAATSSNSGPAMVCFSFFTSQLWEIAELVRPLRETFGDRVLLVAGGPHPSGDPEGTLRLGFDLVVRGEGEETFRELLHCLHDGLDYRTIRGIAFLEPDGTCRDNGRRPPIRLDDFPPYSEKCNRFGPIEISRGCPFVCGYCQTPLLHGARVRHRSVDVLLGHVETLARRGLDDIRFITPNAFAYGSPDGRQLNLPALHALLSEVRRVLGGRGRIFFGSFPSEVRPEHVTPETIALVREFADNDNLVFGAQTGSPRMLERCRRAHTIEDVFRAARLTVQAGFAAYVDFIFGLPGEEEEDIRLSIAAMHDLAKIGARVHAHTFMPLPGTAFAGAPPGRVAPRLRRELDMLIARGHAFGEWERQQGEAARIAAYLRAGKVVDDSRQQENEDGKIREQPAGCSRIIVSSG